jgi:hypothetical protein
VIGVRRLCGDPLVRWRIRRQRFESLRGAREHSDGPGRPLMVCQYASSNQLFQQMNFFMVPTWCQD